MTTLTIRRTETQEVPAHFLNDPTPKGRIADILLQKDGSVGGMARRYLRQAALHEGNEHDPGADLITRSIRLLRDAYETADMIEAETAWRVTAENPPLPGDGLGVNDMIEVMVPDGHVYCTFVKVVEAGSDEYYVYWRPIEDVWNTSFESFPKDRSKVSVIGKDGLVARQFYANPEVTRAHMEENYLAWRREPSWRPANYN